MSSTMMTTKLGLVAMEWFDWFERKVFGDDLEFTEGNWSVVALNENVIFGGPAGSLGRAGVPIGVTFS